MEKAYKYRIYPNKKQKEILAKTFGCCRFVYNYYLEQRMKRYEAKKETFTYVQKNKRQFQSQESKNKSCKASGTYCKSKKRFFAEIIYGYHQKL